MRDNTHLQRQLESILDSLQKCTPLDPATRKRKLFDIQKEYSAPDTQMSIAVMSSRVVRGADGVVEDPMY